MTGVLRRPLFPHGGTREKWSQPSHALTKNQCQLILSASARAQSAGRPFNRFITALWQRGGVEEREATWATQRFLKLAGDWLRLRDEIFCWAYVHEWGPVNGAHVHILMHVPPRLDREFSRMPRQWVKRVSPLGYVTGAVDTKKLRGANAPDGVSLQLYRHDLLNRLHYLLKAAPPPLEAQLGLNGCGYAEWGQSSKVYGKRAGSWQVRGRFANY